ncbi:hypothetical protein GCM10008983_02500 [Lentibacillus halophilus]|uniref:Uncharacterized protein n=1 Tax=Lentibacillus halophilus TaxID=295065 RepID=A0ABP3IXN3_9BACI
MSNVLIGIMPILLLLAVIGLLFAVGMRLLKSTKLSGIVRRWLFPGYLLILVIAFGLSFVLPLEGDSGASGDRTFHKKKLPDLFMIPQNTGSIDMLDDYLVNTWKLETDEETLHLVIRGQENLNNIAVKRKKAADGVVEAELYVTPYVIDGIDMTTGFLPKTHMEVHGRTLAVETPDRKRVDISVFQKNVSVRQFTQKGWLSSLDERGGFGVSTSETTGNKASSPWEYKNNGRLHSTELLYLEIPADVEIEGRNNKNIYMVGNGR